jgi:RNA polymerase primary sigma factor
MIEDAEESLSMEIEDDDDDAAEAAPPAAKRSASSKETEKKKRELISIGKAKGFLTYDEINDHMPGEHRLLRPDRRLAVDAGGEGIEVVDSATQVQGQREGGAPGGGEETETSHRQGGRAEAEEEEDGYSKTNDPGAHVPAQDGVGLAADPRGRVEIAKRIEDGERRVLQVVLNCAWRSRRSSISGTSCAS